MIMIHHLNPRSENILPSHDAQLELQSVHEATQSILIKSLPNLGTWALPNLFFMIKTRVTEVSLPKWSLGSPHSDFLTLIEKTLLDCCILMLLLLLYFMHCDVSLRQLIY